VESLSHWIWRYLRHYRSSIALLALLSCGEVALRVLSPWPLKLVVDTVIGSQRMPPMATWLIWPFTSLLSAVRDPRERMLCAVVVGGLAVQIAHQIVLTAHSRLQAATGHRMVRDLREQLFAHVQALPLGEHARRPAGDILYRLESDACCLEHLVLRGVFPIVFSAFTLVAMFTILVRIDTQLAFISLGIVPLLFLWLRYYTGRMQPAAHRAKHLESGMVQRMHDTLSAIRLVKSYAREEYEQQRFAGAAGEALGARLVTTRQESLFAAVVAILTITGTAGIVIVGGLAVLHGRISLGTLLLLIAYLGFVYGPLCGIANTTGALQQAVASARRIRETLQVPTEQSDEPQAVEAGRLAGHLVFDDVGFSYPTGGPLLNGVSFHAAPGETVALVGMSGAGKTTIASLIMRLYDVSSGRVLIDGHDVRTFTRRSLRQAIAYVSQDTVASSGTIRENLRYGRLDAADEEIECAARAACAHEFIMAQQLGYDTRLGEQGAGLSGGQRQRLSIARALLKNAAILILDEPTAALDRISEDLVFSRLRALQRERTILVIAHRLSTVRSADRILVVDQGRIVAGGRHEDLQRTSPLYRRLASTLIDDRPGEQLATAV
jgi:ABC-type multidrug transport system fused ATPase/permease subunit